MSLLPKRSLRLTGQPTDYYQRFTGSSGEIYYDKTLETLRIFPGNAAVGKVVATFDLGGRLPLGSGSGAIYADQTTGMITIGDYISTTGVPAAPSTVIKVGGAANAFQISAYGPPARVWTFARTGALTLPSAGNLTFPDATVQTTAWTGVADYSNLTNKPVIPGIYSFSVAADDSTQRVVNTDEVVKFIGASGITTASDAEGNITITGTIPSSLINGANTVSLEANGDLTFPSGTLSIENNMFDTVTSTNVLSLQGSSIVLSGGLTNGSFPTLSQINLSTNGNVVVNSDGEYWYFTPNGDLQIPGNVKSESNINIEINLSDSTLRRWQFGEDGSLTLPSVGKINNGEYDWTFGSTGNTTFPTGLTLAAARGPSTVNFLSGVDKEFQIETQTSITSKLWQFGTDGSLTLPGDIKSNGNINIDINLFDSTLRRWQFGEDGLLTFPDGTNQTTAYTGIPGPYADDAAAASAGVAVGYPYHKTGTSGQVFVRLS